MLSLRHLPVRGSRVREQHRRRAAAKKSQVAVGAFHSNVSRPIATAVSSIANHSSMCSQQEDCCSSAMYFGVLGCTACPLLSFWLAEECACTETSPPKTGGSIQVRSLACQIQISTSDASIMTASQPTQQAFPAPKGRRMKPLSPQSLPQELRSFQYGGLASMSYPTSCTQWSMSLACALQDLVHTPVLYLAQSPGWPSPELMQTERGPCAASAAASLCSFCPPQLPYEHCGTAYE
mmetsp:Transcript_11395/g.26324  ORF Transcript_11395/g.26324 Transcript_11395/m.26324 type:complete len:236 (+) Transcript_11395:435-1142(+)